MGWGGIPPLPNEIGAGPVCVLGLTILDKHFILLLGYYDFSAEKMGVIDVFFFCNENRGCSEYSKHKQKR